MAKIRALAPELAEVAYNELNERPAEISTHIATIRHWIESNKHLNSRTDDQFLVAFLRFCKYNIEVTKKRLEYYYTYKTTADEVLKFKQIDEKLVNICKSGIFTALPSPAGPGGPCIHLSRMNLIDTQLYSIPELFRYHTMRAEIEINTDDNWVISGVQEIIDCSKIPYSLLRQFDSSTFKKMAAFLEHGVPTNLKGTHIINAAKEVQLVLNIVRSLMKQKHLLLIHSNLESLHEAIGKEYLPIEYGGNNGTLDDAVARQNKQLLSFTQYFVDDEQYGIKTTTTNDNCTSTSSKINFSGKTGPLSDFSRLEFD